MPKHAITAWNGKFESTEGCDRYQLRLICRCPACDEKIPLPVEWAEGKCQQCGMKFQSMAKRQKPYELVP